MSASIRCATALAVLLASAGTAGIAAAQTKPTVSVPVVSIGVYRPTAGQLQILVDSDHDGEPDGEPLKPPGSSTRVIVGDVDGDWRSDIAVYRNGRWLIDTSRDGKAEQEVVFGTGQDTPLLADFDADGKADLVLFNKGSWRIKRSTDGKEQLLIGHFGNGYVQPAIGDFNHDGKPDLVIYRNGVWRIDLNRNGVFDAVPDIEVTGFGLLDDTPLVFDYDGNGRDDLALFRNGKWFVSTMQTAMDAITFDYGKAGDQPLALHLSPGAEAGADLRYLQYADRDAVTGLARACTHFVDAVKGNDTKDGSTGTPWKSIGKALKSLRAGDVGCVRPGTYLENTGNVRNATGADGTPQAPIVLRAADPDNKPVIVANATGNWIPPIVVNHNYWVFDRLILTGKVDPYRSSAVSDTPGIQVTRETHHVALRHSELRYFARSAAVSIQGKHVLVDTNEIHHNASPDNASGMDVHGVVVPDGYAAAYVTIRRNKIYNNGGDGIQCESPSTAINPDPLDKSADPRPQLNALSSKHIVIDDNTIYTNLGAQNENAIDIKACGNVTIRAGRYHGFRSKPSAPGGYALVLHMGAKRVLVARNQVWDSGGGLVIGRPDTDVKKVTIRNNLFRDIVRPTADDKGHALSIRRAFGVAAYNNTFANIAESAIRAGVDDEILNATTHVDLYNNIFHNANRWLDLDLTGELGKTVMHHFNSDYNLFFNAGGVNATRRICPTDNACANMLDLAGWRQRGFDAHSLALDPQFYEVSSGPSRQYHTREQRIHAAGKATGVPMCRAGDDLGCQCGTGVDLGYAESDCAR